MSNLTHFTFENKGPDSHIVCGRYGYAEHRSSADPEVANCPHCISRMAEFIRDVSDIESDFNGDDSYRLERWADLAKEIIHGKTDE